MAEVEAKITIIKVVYPGAVIEPIMDPIKTTMPHIVDIPIPTMPII
jgi:hypothetical protein